MWDDLLVIQRVQQKWNKTSGASLCFRQQTSTYHQHTSRNKSQNLSLEQTLVTRTSGHGKKSMPPIQPLFTHWGRWLQWLKSLGSITQQCKWSAALPASPHFSRWYFLWSEILTLTLDPVCALTELNWVPLLRLARSTRQHSRSWERLKMLCFSMAEIITFNNIRFLIIWS